MSWMAVAIGGSALIGAIGSGMAADTQAAGQRQAAATQQGMFNTINAQEQPFIQAGYGATNLLNQLLGIGGSNGGSAPTRDQYTKTTPGTRPSTVAGMLSGYGVQPAGAPGSTSFDQAGYDKAMTDWQAQQPGPGGTAGSTGLPLGYLTSQFKPTQDQLNDYPGYQFALQTGGQAIRNRDTPGVGALSGAALKDLMSFNVGTANQFYGQYFNQDQQEKNNIFSRLSGIAGLGQNAASNVGTSGTSLGTGIAQAQAAAGGSQAAGIAGATNAIGNAGVPLAYLMNNGAGGTGAGQSASLNANSAQLFGS
jgi:hypothetical protein